MSKFQQIYIDNNINNINNTKFIFNYNILKSNTFNDELNLITLQLDEDQIKYISDTIEIIKKIKEFNISKIYIKSIYKSYENELEKIFNISNNSIIYRDF